LRAFSEQLIRAEDILGELEGLFVLKGSLLRVLTKELLDIVLSLIKGIFHTKLLPLELILVYPAVNGVLHRHLLALARRIHTILMVLTSAWRAHILFYVNYIVLGLVLFVGMEVSH